ncbi:NADH-quinone oxidoreductase subunit NuoK [Moraxella sp. FZLJ2107]|uniref:NADH-quinone oxidoreductase subunit NuoK n=2 Tax=unclassified Moraxella TaxID=2685852 RepID=UPI003531C924
MATNLQTSVTQAAAQAGEQIANLGIPVSHALMLCAILFAIGLVGVMARRNVLFMLMSLEIMMNSTALAFVVGGNIWGSPDGQVMFIFVLTLAAAEAAIGLAILLQFYHRFRNLDVNQASRLKG